MAEVYGSDSLVSREAYLRWQYDRNPHGPAIVFVADAPGELAGQYAIIPTRLTIGGESKLAMLSLNTVTSPRFQRQGIFSELAERAYEVAQHRGAVGVIGFPNSNSFSGFVKRLSFGHVGTLDTWIRPRRAGTVVARGKPLGAHLRVADWLTKAWYHVRSPQQPTPSLLPIHDAISLMPGVEKPIKLGLGFTKEWLAWRYDPSTGWPYEQIRDGEAVIFCRHYSFKGMRMSMLLDFGARWDSGDRRPLARTIRAALARAQAMDSAVVCSMLSPGHPAARYLRSAGFLKLPRRLMQSPPAVIYRALDGSEGPRSFENWVLSGGSYDIA